MGLNGTVCYLLVSRCLPLIDGENRGGLVCLSYVVT